jgi:hypothetical protein
VQRLFQGSQYRDYIASDDGTIIELEAPDRWELAGDAEVLEANQLQIPRDLSWNPNRATVVRCWRLTAWAMAQPNFLKNT